MSPQLTMTRWLQRATTAQARELAAAAKTSVPHLRHIAAGRRNAEAALALRIARGSRSLGERALIIDQRDICKTCGVCPLAKKTKAA
jgi:hypothetical protein